MSKKRLLLSLIAIAAAGLPAASVSCQDTVGFIVNYINLNTSEVTVYDTLDDLNTNSPLKISNSKYFKNKGITVSLGSTSIDYENEVVNIVINFRSKEQSKKRKITLTKQFYEFKEPDNNDWARIFNAISEISQIEWLGDGKFNITNKYAKVSNEKIAPIGEAGPRAEDFSYTLTIIDSAKILGEVNDRQSRIPLKGGILIDRIKDKITLTYKIPNNEDVIDVSFEKNFKRRDDLIPVKEKHIFKGWSTKENATMPDVFLNGAISWKFDKDTILWPVFESYAKLNFDIPVFPGDPKKTAEIILGATGIVSKERIKEFIDESLPRPLDYWTYDIDKIFYTDENNEKYNLTFDEYDNVTFKFKVGHVYKLNIDFKHLPRFIFKDSEGNILGSQWFKDDENNMLTPDINLKAINDKEAEGFYIETNKLKYEVDNSSFSSSVPIPDSVADNYNNIYVITKFRLGKQISIETKEFEEDYAKSISSKIFLRLDGRLQEKYVPKDVDFSWYKGERKGIFNGNSKNTQNNEAFDKRNEFEKEKGVIFEGWYADPQFKNKVEFKDGISTKPFKGSTLYPKFGIHKWDKIRDIRKILDIVFNILSTAANVTGVIEKAEKYSNLIEYIINIIRWIINLSLGGKTSYDEFWRGYDNINNLIFESIKISGKDFPDIIKFLKLNRNLETIKDLNDDIFQAIQWLTKDIAKNIFGIYQKYSNNKYKGSAFTDKNLDGWNIQNILGKEPNDINDRKKYLTYILYNGSIGKLVAGLLWKQKDKSKNKECEWDQKPNLLLSDIEIKNNLSNGFKSKFIEKINIVADAFAGKNGIFEIVKEIIEIIISATRGEIDNVLLGGKIISITSNLARAIKNIVTNKFWYYSWSNDVDKQNKEVSEGLEQNEHQTKSK
ncbi:InlB B-repeat-containing protein [Mycoplasma phocimorsus]|uniref:InlB B-repeat-containing protein n=1 Tax=Mycoplasma phocimorsus TaxID=3045839 RepID=UPI0024C0287E|nr:InlB B-repeat-containing protein [Mycoplasma phocimorsus]MDJ1648795.1 InlB B-repeat-containing protein [Mycoplasma phocimorsus]